MYLLRNTTVAMQALSKPGPNILASACSAIRKMDSLYGADDCGDCLEYPSLPARKDLKRMKAPDTTKMSHPCWQSLRRTEYKCRTDPEFAVESFISDRKKCLKDCADTYPSADRMFYRPSDKLKRKYQRTWVECVLKRRKRKAKCILKPVSIKRRKRTVHKISTCETGRDSCSIAGPKLDLMAPPKGSKDGPCPRIAMPFCKSVAANTRCKLGTRGPGQCRKRLTKYPSFSECLIDPLPDAPPTECKCLAKPSMCEVWEYYRRKKF